MVEKVGKDYEEEIDLYEVFLILKKRFRYILSIFLAGIVLGSIIAFIKPDIYKAKATLWVESFLPKKIFEYWLKNYPKHYFSSFLLLKEDSNSMVLAILNNLEFKKRVLEQLKTFYGNEVISKIEKDISKGKGNKLFSAKQDKETEAIILTSEQENKKLAEDILKVAINELQKELDHLSQVYYKNLLLSPENKIFVVNVIEPPSVIKDPVKPQRGLIIVIAGVSFLFLGIFFAFLIEWWNKVSKRELN